MKFARFKTLRPKQWSKNLICFVPLLFSGRFGNYNSIVSCLVCFIGLCAISSAIYVLNDFIDIESDKAHPTKKFRPIAAGEIGVFDGQLLTAACLMLGLVAGFYARPTLALVFIAYVVLNLFYVFALKKVVILDILCISSGFVLRAIAGAVAINVQPSEWFLLCTTLGAMFLALEKRRHELNSFVDASRPHRLSLAQYTPQLLQRMENVILPCLITSYAFYSFLSFHGKFLMLTVPIVLFGIMRYQYLSENDKGTDTPEDIFWRDRPIQFTLVAWVVTSTIVVYGNPATWLQDTARMADRYHVRELSQ